MDEIAIGCPYCGETIDILVDSSAGDHEYYEDCSVCCSPILFEVIVDILSGMNVIAKRDDE
ncbi:MAG: CPXCG motif-containing cysteine-rich protein [Methylococcales bacterium]|nr:CPXCG motif-containing cysteine-rich protein [Methylococcales bacterium]